jgi:outer membrane protein assembly factor BamB
MFMSFSFLDSRGRRLTCCAAVSLALTGACLQTRAEDWPQWRGPALNGSSLETHLPTEWSKTNGVAWATPLPGKSGATPIVWKDSIFVPSPDADKNLRLYCIDAKTGAVRWNKNVATGNREAFKNNMAASSAITDGQRVYIFFGTGDFAAFDFAGNELWHRKLQEDYGALAYQFLYGASPLLHEGRLYLTLMQHDPPKYSHAVDEKKDRKSCLICFDAASGKTLWEKERKTGALDESMEAYTTPMLSPTANGAQIVLVGANWVNAYRVENGDEAWRFPNLNPKNKADGRIIPSATVVPGLVIACGSKRDWMVALKADASGITDKSQIVWSMTNNVPDVCTPLYYNGKLFVLDGDKHVLQCLKPATGEVLWKGNLGVEEVFSASPTGADGKIFCMSEPGTVVVLSAGDQFKILNTIEMDEGPSTSSIVAANGQLLIRTAGHLYCIRSAAQ